MIYYKSSLFSFTPPATQHTHRVRLEARKQMILVGNKELTEPGAWAWKLPLGISGPSLDCVPGNLNDLEIIRCSLKKGFCGQ